MISVFYCARLFVCVCVFFIIISVFCIYEYSLKLRVCLFVSVVCVFVLAYIVCFIMMSVFYLLWSYLYICIFLIPFIFVAVGAEFM